MTIQDEPTFPDATAHKAPSQVLSWEAEEAEKLLASTPQTWEVSKSSSHTHGMRIASVGFGVWGLPVRLTGASSRCGKTAAARATSTATTTSGELRPL